METFGLRDHGRPGLHRLSKSLIGLLCALSMLLTGMLAAGTAQAEEAAADTSGDVTLDWNWGGHTPEEARDLPRVLSGTRNENAWTPTLSGDTYLYMPWGGTVDGSIRDFYGWNTKPDGSGQWYDFRSCDKINGETCSSEYVLIDPPTTDKGDIAYPDGGTLYAQWADSNANDPRSLRMYKANTADQIRNLSLFVSGYEGKHLVRQLFLKACDTPVEMSSADAHCGNGVYLNRHVNRSGADGTMNISLAKMSKGVAAFDQMLSEAFADKNIRYIGIDAMGPQLAVIDIRSGSVDPKLNTADSPRFSLSNPVSKATYNEKVDIKRGITAKDKSGQDISSSITVSKPLDVSILGNQWVQYDVTDSNGNSANLIREIRVTPAEPSASDLTEKNHIPNMIPNDEYAGGEIFPLVLGKEHAGETYSLYEFEENDVWHHGSGGTVISNGNIDYNIDKTGTYRIAIILWSNPSRVIWDSVKITSSVDHEKPEVKGADDTTVDLNSHFDPKEGVTAEDNFDGDVTDKIKVQNRDRDEISSFDTSQVGQQELYYVVSDAAGNENDWSRVINVVPSVDDADSILTGARKDTAIVPNDVESVRSGSSFTFYFDKQYQGKKVGVLFYPPASTRMYAKVARATTAAANSRIILSNDALVAEDGTVTVQIPASVAAGSYRLAVVYDGGLSWNDLRVLPAESQIVQVTAITVSGQRSLTVGDATQLAVTVEPDEATDKTVSWSSSNEQVATVDKNTGKVSAKAEGKATITATANDGSNVSGELEVTVTAKNPSKVDKTDLDKTVKDIENAGLKQSDYTADSWKAFQDALAKAKTVQKDANATQEQVDDAVKALTAAKNGLKKPTPSQPSGPSTPSQPSAPEVSSKPNKLEYRIGEQFDATGMVVKYQGHVLGPDQYTVTLDTSKPGKVKASVTLDSDPTKTTSFEVTVVVSDTVVHRLYNRWSGEHFYTANDTEYQALVKAKWTDEGTAFTMADYGTPVYRLYLPGGKHLFTTSEKERDALKAGKWRDEGIAFHVRDDGTAKTDVYRLYNPWTGDHLLTTSANERGVLALNKWHVEGTAFQAK